MLLDPRWPVAAAQDDLDRELLGGDVRADAAAVVVIGLGGAASLACEVAWSRLVALVLGGTTYAFTGMLLAVLLGVALGGRAGGTLADVAFRRGGTAGVLRGLALTEALIGLVCWGLTFVWPELPYWFVIMYDLVGGDGVALAPFASAFLVCLLALLPPATLMGVAFPLAVRAAAGDQPRVGRPVAQAYAANTLGGVVGAAAAGFVLLPWLSVRGVVGVAAALNLVAAALAWWRGGVGGSERWALLGFALAMAGVVGLVRAPWDPLWMAGGLHHYVSDIEHHRRESLHWFATGDQELLFYAEGLSTVVTVGRNGQTGNRWLANNGKVDASSQGDMSTQVLCGMVGAQHVNHPEKSLVIGLASGVTAGAVAQLPGVHHLEVAELEGAIVQAARWFETENFGVLDDPKVELIINDGRNHVFRAPEGAWDYIVSEPPNPYLSGVADLFTRDFWEVGRTRLAPGGVWAQWVQLYGMGQDDLRSLLRTFARSYPHVALYAGLDRSEGAQADIVLVAAEHPLEPTFERAERLLADPRAASAMRQVGVYGPADLVSMHAMDRDAVLAMVGEGPEVTDDNMRIEYSAPLHLHRHTMTDNWDLIRKAARVPWEHLPEDPARLEDLADAYEAHGDERRANEVRAAL